MRLLLIHGGALRGVAHGPLLLAVAHGRLLAVAWLAVPGLLLLVDGGDWLGVLLPVGALLCVGPRLRRVHGAGLALGAALGRGAEGVGRNNEDVGEVREEGKILKRRLWRRA